MREDEIRRKAHQLGRIGLCCLDIAAAPAAFDPGAAPAEFSKPAAESLEHRASVRIGLLERPQGRNPPARWLRKCRNRQCNRHAAKQTDKPPTPHGRPTSHNTSAAHLQSSPNPSKTCL